MVSGAFSTFPIGAALAVYLVDVFEDSLDRLRADGIIVLDSTAYIRGTLHWTKYMTDLLYDIYMATGQRCIAVALGGMSFVGSLDRFLVLLKPLLLLLVSFQTLRQYAGIKFRYVCTVQSCLVYSRVRISLDAGRRMARNDDCREQRFWGVPTL